MAEPSETSQYLIGVDFGGTKLYAGVFKHTLQLVGASRISTKPQRGVGAVTDRIARVVQDAVDECDLDLKQIRGVGIGAPGAVDTEAGRIIFAPNLEWRDVPLKKDLEKILGVPVFLENDCNVAMLGVYEVELESKPKHAVGIFLGTGIGGGIIIDGAFYSGFNRTAGEVGHMVIETGGPKCGCGNNGCFEALASRTAIFRRLREGVKEGQKTVLTEMLGKDLEDMRSGDLRKAIKRGDKFAEKVVEEAAEYTGIAVANLMNILNPEVIVLGGGVIEALEDQMMAIIIETAMDYAMPGTAKGIKIVASKLGDDAGITGAAVLARRETRKASK
jgi:glucokinase